MNPILEELTALEAEIAEMKRLHQRLLGAMIDRGGEARGMERGFERISEEAHQRLVIIRRHIKQGEKR